MNQQFSPDERPDSVTSSVLEEHLRSVYQAVRETTPPYSAPISEVVPLVQRRTFSNVRTLGFSVAASIALITIGITARAVLNSPGHKAKVTPAAQGSGATTDSRITFTSADLQTPGFFVPQLVPVGQDPSTSSFEAGFIDPDTGNTFRPYAIGATGFSIPADLQSSQSVMTATGATSESTIDYGMPRLLGQFSKPDRPNFYMAVFLADTPDALDGMQGMTSKGVTQELESVQPLVKYRDPLERGWVGYRSGTGSVQIAIIGKEILPEDIEAVDEFVTNSGQSAEAVVATANEVTQPGGLAFGEVLPYGMAGFIRSAESDIPVQTEYLTEYTIDGKAPKDGDPIYQFRQVMSFTASGPIQVIGQLISDIGQVTYSQTPLEQGSGVQVFIGISSQGPFQPVPPSAMTTSVPGDRFAESPPLTISESLSLVSIRPEAFKQIMNRTQSAGGTVANSYAGEGIQVFPLTTVVADDASTISNPPPETSTSLQ